MSDRRAAKRVVIVFDGECWFLRRLVCIEHALNRDEKIYYCDKHIGGPYATLESLASSHESLLRPLATKEIGPKRRKP